MKKLILALALVFSGAVSANIYLENCSAFSTPMDPVPYSFQSCINRNFRKVDRALNTFSSFCSNIGGGVSYSFTACVQRNFSSVDLKLPAMYLEYCSNFSRDRLDFSYVSCINRNYRKIATALNRRDQ